MRQQGPPGGVAAATNRGNSSAMRLTALWAAFAVAMFAAAGIAEAAAPADGTPAPNAAKAAPAGKQAIIVVPPSYHAAKQPEVYVGAKFLTSVAGGTTYAAKYKKIYGLLQRDPRLMANIKKAAEHYGVPVEEKDWHDLGKKPHTPNPAHKA